MTGNRSSADRAGATYEIRFEGRIQGEWSAWLPGCLESRLVYVGGRPETCLTVWLPDQCALRGLLGRLWDSNLSLTSVSRIEPVACMESDHDR